MEFFIDTADVEAIRKANDMGFISGVTTNPSLIAKEGKDFHATIKEIASIVDGPISAEVLADDAEGMIAEGKVLAALDPHVVVKIPMTAEGMKAVKGLAKAGIRTNVTLIFSANQALLAARAGASFVSPFVGRIDDIGWDGVELIQTISEIFELHGIETKIIAASIRKPQHMTQCALAGADIARRRIVRPLHSAAAGRAGLPAEQPVRLQPDAFGIEADHDRLRAHRLLLFSQSFFLV